MRTTKQHDATSSQQAHAGAGPEQADLPAPADEQLVYEAVRAALQLARSKTVVAVNAAMVAAYWEIGRQIALAAGDRAEYGKRLMLALSRRLTAEFGKGFTPRNLWHMRQFYETFQNMHALRAELSWTHYRLLMRVPSAERREWYMNEAANEGWSSRQLDRQINTAFYDRLLATRKADQREALKAEIRQEMLHFVQRDIKSESKNVLYDYCLKIQKNTAQKDGIPRGGQYSLASAFFSVCLKFRNYPSGRSRAASALKTADPPASAPIPASAPPCPGPFPRPGREFF